MKLVILSDSSENNEEPALINFFFENGLDYYHLRKGKYTKKEMSSLLDRISKKYHSKIVIHSHHELAIKYKLFGIHISRKKRKSKFNEWLKVKYFRFKNSKINISTSFSQLTNFEDTKSVYDYVFLSPIFDSISASGYGSHFNIKLVENMLKKTPEKVIALGGINSTRIKQVKDIGFYGAAISGAIWESKTPKETFLEIKKKLDEEELEVST